MFPWPAARRGGAEGESYLIESCPFAERGESDIYRATDSRGNRWVLETPKLEAGWDSLERFQREFMLLKGLDHPAILWCEDYQNSALGQYAIVEALEGGDLLGDAGSLGVDEIVDVGVQVSGALGYLAALTPPTVHGDINPQNLHRTKAGSTRVKVVGFGLARWVGEPGGAEGSAGGSPAYAAPEQFYHDCGRIGPGSDVYSLGRTLLCLLSPFGADQEGPPRPDSRRGPGVEEIAAEVADPARRSEAAEGPGGGLLGVIARATNPDRRRRYRSGAEMDRDLLRLARRRGTRLTPLERTCPRCKHLLPEGADRCGFDGYPIREALAEKRRTLGNARRLFLGNAGSSVLLLGAASRWRQH